MLTNIPVIRKLSKALRNQRDQLRRQFIENYLSEKLQAPKLGHTLEAKINLGLKTPLCRTGFSTF